MSDYETLLDDEILAFIATTESFYPPDAAHRSMSEQRQFYAALCKAFHAGRPSGVSVHDSAIASGTHDIPIRSYTYSASQPAAQIVFFHGGGYVLGDLDSHDDICGELCAETGFPVTIIDYRLAPEHTHPAAFEDCCAGFNHAAAGQDLPVILVGDSAGGNLAAAVSHAARAQAVRPAGQVLIYPALGGDRTAGSYFRHANAPLLSASDIAAYDRLRCAGVPPLADPTFAPLADVDFADLPPTVAIMAACDPLASDGIDYCALIRNAGGKAHAIEEAGLVHGYLRARHQAKRAKASFRRIIGAITALGHGQWPYPDEIA